MKKIEVNNEINRIHSWLLSWIDNSGAVHGPVLHKRSMVFQGWLHLEPMTRVDSIKETTWTQALALIAYTEVYKKSKNKEIFSLCKKIAKKLVFMQKKNGSYSNANFEHDTNPKMQNSSALIHQSTPNIALLRFYEINNNPEIVEVVKKSVSFLLSERYYNNKNGLFRNFEGANSMSHTINMISVALESLVRLGKLTKDEKYINIAKTHAEWLLKQFKKDYFPYSDYEEEYEPLPFYNGITLQGLDDIYDYTHDKRYLILIRKIIKYLKESIDPETGFLYHRKTERGIKRFPQYIAALGLILWNILEVKKYGFDFPIDKLISNLKEKVSLNGGIHSYYGYDNWRDIFPSPCWVIMSFLALVSYSDKISLEKLSFKKQIIKKGSFVIIDEKDRLTLKKNNKILWLAKKKSDLPIINKIKSYYQKCLLLDSITRPLLRYYLILKKFITQKS